MANKRIRGLARLFFGTVPDDQIHRAYRVRVALFFVLVVTMVAALFLIYQVAQTLSRLNLAEGAMSNLTKLSGQKRVDDRREKNDGRNEVERLPLVIAFHGWSTMVDYVGNVNVADAIFIAGRACTNVYS
jgi:hypothetical protein